MKMIVVVTLLALSLVAACRHAQQETTVKTEIHKSTTTIGPGPAAEIK